MPVCISVPKELSFTCVDEEGVAYIVPFSESDKYIAFSPENYKRMMFYARRHEL